MKNSVNIGCIQYPTTHTPKSSGLLRTGVRKTLQLKSEN